MTLKDIGEKKIIETIIKPLLNPFNDKKLVGDDCAVIINTSIKNKICVSTDRVPSDLLAFKYGLINYFELGIYLASLNISDCLAAGAIPKALLLNLAFPKDFEIKDLQDILLGADSVCKENNIAIVGGDLSDSIEMNLTATIIGFSKNPIYRKGIRIQDLIFCSDYVGLTPTAFKYFFHARKRGLKLSNSEENTLLRQFSKPELKFKLSNKLSKLKKRVCCMDNTDGIGQSLKELGEINSISINLFYSKIPIHSITLKVAKFLQIDPIDLALEPGADFQLVGSVSKDISFSLMKKLGLYIIGTSESGEGITVTKHNEKKSINIKGWNYYK